VDKPVSFHERLRHARLARNWTQADLAEKLDCATRTVNRWEIDQFPNSKYRQRLCELFEITAEDFGLLQKEQTTHPVEHTFSAPAISPAKTLLDEQFSISVAIQEAVRQLDGTSQVQGVREDWDEAPSFKQVYGRDQELAELQEWIDDEHYRVIVIFGMGGTGKTVLATKLAQQAKDGFEYVFWRSLQQAPPLKQILQQAVQFLSEQQRITLPKDVDDQIRLLMQYLRALRCLLVLDNVESLFQPG
jgi:transcriptional regulator with XRE-family HTH domain